MAWAHTEGAGGSGRSPAVAQVVHLRRSHRRGVLQQLSLQSQVSLHTEATQVVVISFFYFSLK